MSTPSERVQKITTSTDTLMLEMSMVTIDHPNAAKLMESYNSLVRIRTMLDVAKDLTDNFPNDMTDTHLAYLQQIEEMSASLAGKIREAIQDVH